MVMQIALGIVLGIAALLALALVAPLLIEVVAEVLGSHAVQVGAVVVGLLVVIQWWAQEHEWIWLFVAACLVVAVVGSIVAAIGALARDAWIKVKEYRGKPTRFVTLELERRRALGYDVDFPS